MYKCTGSTADLPSGT